MEASVSEDMANQRRWYTIMQPLAAMLKFRLPWSKGKTEYLDGEVFLPIWGPQTTTEARLICGTTRGCGVKLWDNTMHCDQMFYFNSVTRLMAYDHDVREAQGLDHCYDCAAEVCVLRQYLLR